MSRHVFTLLIPGKFYRLIIDGRHYPIVYRKVVDLNGDNIYVDGLPTEEISLPVDASCVLIGRSVRISIGNLGSVHAEALFNTGYISPAYNAEKKRFEIRRYDHPYPGSYVVVATT